MSEARARSARIRDLAARAGAPLRPLFDTRSRLSRRLAIAFGVVVGAACVLGLPELLRAFYVGNDIELPLRAAARWASGGEPYPASAMLVAGGPDLPYLYPPFLLPLIAPLTSLPRLMVTGPWLAFCAACAIWTCRHLGAPWWAVPIVLAWPPFAEGLIVGNVQIVSFAAFAALVYERDQGGPVPRDFRRERDLANGVLAMLVAAFKFTQALPGLYLLRRRFRAATFGALAITAVIVLTLPFTGIAVYGDWLAQLQRANDPAWVAAGVAPARIFGMPALPLLALGAAMALLVRGRDAVAWLGIALIVATPSAHAYTFLFLVPALLAVRRDLAIGFAALFLGSYHGYAWYMACLLVTYLLVAGRIWPWLRAAGPASAPVAAASDVNS